jgi:phosphotransferase system HPr-like phosphotransfer protein
LQSSDLIKQFTKTISGLNGRFEVHSDRTVLDARSVLGLYGLDLSYPILLRVENDCSENMEMLKPFIVSG